MRAVLLLALLLPFAAGEHAPRGRCDVDSGGAWGIVEVSGGSADTTFYVDDRKAVFGSGVWLYRESNGIWTGTDPPHDLQRGGESVVDPVLAPFVPESVWNDDEVCVDDPLVAPDTLVY